MSKAKMQAAKEFIQAKNYDKARAILKTVDHPTAREWEMKLDKIAPPKPRKANRVMLLFFAIVLLIVVAYFGLSYFNQSTSWAGAAMEAAMTEVHFDVQTEMPAPDTFSRVIDVQSAISVYCERVTERSKGSCERLANTLIQSKYPELRACYDEYNWITDRDNFTLCLAVVGISVLSDNGEIPPLDIESFDPEAFQVLYYAVNYCEDVFSHDYCRVLMVSIFERHRTQFTQCYRQHIANTETLSFRNYDACIGDALPG